MQEAAVRGLAAVTNSVGNGGLKGISKQPLITRITKA